MSRVLGTRLCQLLASLLTISFVLSTAIVGEMGLLMNNYCNDRDILDMLTAEVKGTSSPPNLVSLPVFLAFQN